MNNAKVHRQLQQKDIKENHVSKCREAIRSYNNQAELEFEKDKSTQYHSKINK